MPEFMMLGDVRGERCSHLEVDGGLSTVLRYLTSPCAFYCDKTITWKKRLGEGSE